MLFAAIKLFVNFDFSVIMDKNPEEAVGHEDFNDRGRKAFR